MDSQPPLACDREKLSMLRFCCLLLPPEEYTTYLTQFPGTNCHPPYGLGGYFYVSIRAYEKGKLIGEIHSRYCDHTGVLDIDLQDLTQFYSPESQAILIVDFMHPRDVPVELYFRNYHKRTGTYLAYPTLAFIGDEIYAELHSEMLENTLFWPGVVSNSECETGVMLANPYDMPYSYQVSLYLGEERVAQSKVFKISARHGRTHKVSDLFPEFLDRLAEHPGQSALCVAAQYKVMAYVNVFNKKHGVYSTLDHLHGYLFV